MIYYNTSFIIHASTYGYEYHSSFTRLFLVTHGFYMKYIYIEREKDFCKGGEGRGGGGEVNVLSRVYTLKIRFPTNGYISPELCTDGAHSTLASYSSAVNIVMV